MRLGPPAPLAGYLDVVRCINWQPSGQSGDRILSVHTATQALFDDHSGWGLSRTGEAFPTCAGTQGAGGRNRRVTGA